MVSNLQAGTEATAGYYRPDDPAEAVEFDSFLALLPTLRAEHGGQYVAVQNGRVVTVGVHLSAVLKQAEAVGGPFYCGWIEPPGGSVVRFGSPTVLSETPAS